MHIAGTNGKGSVTAMVDAALRAAGHRSARYTSPQSGINIQLMTRDATAAEDPVISVRVDDIDAAYIQARERGYEIVHPLTTEEWGVTRFFVRAPDGNILNVVQHRD